MADLTNIPARLGTMPAKKLVALILTLGLTVAALMMLFTWTHGVDYQLLYANLNEEDAGQIIQKLNEQKIPYSTSSGGIMVPGDKVYELRLQLASQGLPQGGGVGFELFDKTSFTMTDFVQKLNYRRALQGELTRTIRSLSEIDQCRVHLAVPEKSLFAQKEDRPKASVLIKLRTGRRLSQGQVRGIVHLVSSSVEGLDPKDVSVVDSAGEMLTSAHDDSLSVSGDHLEFQRAYEKEIENRIISMLEPVVGKAKVRARVAATMDFTKIEKTEERYDPDSQVVRSEQRNVEKNSNMTGGGGGVPGIASNIPSKAGQAQAAPSREHQTQTEKKNETVNYEISKVISHIVSPAGEVKRLSIVALVDGAYTAAKDSAEKKYTPRSEEDLRQFEDMVKKAVGFSAERGDEVKVMNMPFETAPHEEISETGQAAPPIMPSVMTSLRYLVPVGALIIVFLLVVKPLMRVLTAPPSIADRRVELPQSVGQLERVIEQKEITARDQLTDWAKKNPKEATGLVKGWLEER